jgi:hypothetical protein
MRRGCFRSGGEDVNGHERRGAAKPQPKLTTEHTESTEEGDDGPPTTT